MKIYVGTYHKYNCGNLFGEWVDITDYADKDDFYAYCAELHKDEEDPEFMFQDYEDIPEIFISESWVSEKLWGIPDHIDMDAFAAFVDNYGLDPDDDEIFDKFDDSFQGSWDSLEAYAENYFDDVYLHEIPEYLRCYIDYEKFTRDFYGYSYVDGYVFCDDWGLL